MMHFTRFSAVTPCRAAAVALVSAFLLLMPVSGKAASIPPEVQKGVDAILAMKDPKAPVPDKQTLDAFLAYTTAGMIPGADGNTLPAPAKIGSNTGIFWRSKTAVPMAAMLEYLYNPKVPMEAIYPASIRWAKWLPGSDILSLSTPLWKQLGQHKDQPLVLRGSELEQITPDDNTGAYYQYTLDRVVLLTEYEGKNMLISLGVQRGRSEVGKKAATIGKYENWDFVYSNTAGTLASMIGWAETYIYDSTSLVVLYEDAPGSRFTGFAMYRWMNAGWSNMNMVKDHHMVAGAGRSFNGLRAFMESPNRPSAADIAAHNESLKSLDLATLRQRFKPYSVAVEEAAKSNGDLRSDDFQKIIKNAGYGDSLSKEDIISAMNVNFIKQRLGKPLLAGPLD